MKTVEQFPERGKLFIPRLWHRDSVSRRLLLALDLQFPQKVIELLVRDISTRADGALDEEVSIHRRPDTRNVEVARSWSSGRRSIPGTQRQYGSDLSVVFEVQWHGCIDDEAAGLIEHGLSTHSVFPLRALGINTAERVIQKGLMCGDNCTRLFPLFIITRRHIRRFFFFRRASADRAESDHSDFCDVDRRHPENASLNPRECKRPPQELLDQLHIGFLIVNNQDMRHQWSYWFAPGYASICADRFHCREYKRCIQRTHEFIDVNRLGEVTKGAGLEALPDIARHRIAAACNHWNVRRCSIFAQDF